MRTYLRQRTPNDTDINGHCVICFTSVFLFILGSITITGCREATTDIDIIPVKMSQFTVHLDTLKTRYKLTNSLKATKMVVTIQENGREPEEIRESLWYKKSEDGGELLHIQALGAFNEPRGIAIANRDKFLLVLLDEQEVYLGELSDGVLKKIFGLDLRVSDVLSAIFANPFLDGRTDALKITRSGQKFTVKRIGAEDQQTETITLIVKNGEPRVTEWYIKNKDQMLQQSAVFSDYHEVDGILRSHKVEIERPFEKTRIVVKMSQAELNVEINDNRFNIEPFLNGDFEIIPLSELSGIELSE